MKKKLLSIILMSSLVFSLFGCAGGAASSSNVIKIGVFEPITGAYADGGGLELKGIQLANKLYPEVLGKKVELAIADNKSDKVEAANAVSKLIEQDKVKAILGSWGSSLAIAAGDIVRNAKIPAVGCSCTNPLVTQGNDYYFRVCFIDPFQGTVMANYAYNDLKAKKVAIVENVADDYSVGLANFFVEQFTKLSGDSSSIVDTQKYNTGDTDFSAQLQNLKAKNPDAIFAPGNYTESAMMIKQAKQLGIQTPFIGGDTWEVQAFIDVGGSDVEGSVFSSFFDPSNPINDETRKFVEEYKKAYNEEPSGFAVNAYDAYLVLIDAIKRANSDDPVKIRDAIATTKDFKGATGSISLDENGDAIKDAVLKTVQDGKFVFKGIAKAE